MLQLGAHNSIAGGLYRAVEDAGTFGMDVVQLFTGNPKRFSTLKEAFGSDGFLTKNNNQWAGKPLVDEDVSQFRDALARHGVRHPLSHASYLINLAAPADELWEKSIESMVVELRRAERLGVRYVVVHPGAFTTTTAEQGIARVATAINRVHEQVHVDDFQAEILLENTAGQGSSLGHDFEHLGAMLAGIARADRVGVCFDTCHAFAAGHGFAEAEDFLAMKRAIDDAFGLDKIRAIHLNDSKKARGSRVDRHEHIGEGLIGLEGFRRFLNDPFFATRPMYLETPKDERDGEHWDAINLRTVRGLTPGAVAAPRPATLATKSAVASSSSQASGGRKSSEYVAKVAPPKKKTPNKVAKKTPTKKKPKS